MHRSVIGLYVVGISSISIALNLDDSNTVANCSCGYYDAASQRLWTESIIVYFNETTVKPIPGFVEESYTHKVEKGWNTQYRTGADKNNIDFVRSSSAANASTSLELRVSPYEPDHLVIGSSMRTFRQDLQYGSFTSLLRSPAKYAGRGGSVLTFALEYNSTQSISTNLQNTDTPSTASISMLANDEASTTSSLEYDSMTNEGFGNSTVSPWDYTEYRLDWTKDEVQFFIGGNTARSISRGENEKLLSVPCPLYLRHWSNGLARGSQGPPDQSTVANVGWVRLFFNSSLMSESDHISFDSRCQTSSACASNDVTLRGSSVWSERSTQPWKQAPEQTQRKLAAIWLAVASISLTALLLLNPLWKRVRERLSSAQKRATPSGVAQDSNFRSQRQKSSVGSVTLNETGPCSGSAAIYNPSGLSTPSPIPESSHTFRRRSTFPIDESSCEDQGHDEAHEDSEQKIHSKPMPTKVDLSAEALTRTADETVLIGSPTAARKEEGKERPLVDETTTINDWRISWNSIRWGVNTSPGRQISSADDRGTPPTSALAASGIQPEVTGNFRQRCTIPPEDRARTEYLAGLIVISCLTVTAINFNLTFLFGDLLPAKPTQHREVITRKAVTSFFLKPIWVGPFLLISARFLTVSYLRTGDLIAVADKTVKRTFRLMLPVTAIVMLEYFFIDCSATKWLEYLPSITWSTWPYIEGYRNFGSFVSEILELVYLVPNAVPAITFNFCTNVLWTIPVQLQGSWTTLLSVVVIREIKKPWKRFCFYAFCIVNHWYALSWGSYFYCGIVLADLDVTYKWQKYLHARWFVFYPLLTSFILAMLAGPTIDLLAIWTKVEYVAYEYSIHPNVTSGLPLKASHAANPQFFSPRLNGLIFAVGFQAATEISPLIQKILSVKLLMAIYPHVFTVYLLHGFIFWSLGSWLCVFLAVRGLSFWSNILIVALCCYTTLALSAPVVTPVLDCLGKSITTDIWREATEEPAPRHPTLYPFPKDLLLNRYDVPYERKPSKDVSTADLERRFSRDVRKIPRERKPSKDITASWHERTASSNLDRGSWQERKASSNRDKSSWHERKASLNPDRHSWHERKASTDLRVSWPERNASQAVRLETVADEEAH